MEIHLKLDDDCLKRIARFVNVYAVDTLQIKVEHGKFMKYKTLVNIKQLVPNFRSSAWMSHFSKWDLKQKRYSGNRHVFLLYLITG